MSHWHELGPDVFLFADTCNVYALRDGERALLFDLGSGDCLDALGEIGVAGVDAICFTHAHRDQCQGWAKAHALDIPLRFPVGARAHLAADERPDWRLPAPTHLAYPCPFKLPAPIPPARFDLAHYSLWDWGPFDILAWQAAGHVAHQLAFRVDAPGGSYLFCGDALHSRGRVHEPYHLETDHYTGAGARLAADTLCALRNLRAEALCPSHGPVTTEGVWDAFTVTAERLRALADLKDTIVPRRPEVTRLVRPHAGRFHQVSEHLWLWGNSYFLVSDDGPVLMVDVQTKLPESFHEQYREALGDRPIEVVLVSHCHCDHVMGIEDLRLRHPSLECWALDRLVESIEHPYRLARPWLHGDPAVVDRALLEDEEVAWHEHSLTPFWFPGQTDLHALYALEVDGRKAVFSGDNFYPAQQWGGTGGLCGFNGGHPALWRQSAELMMWLEPEWVLASHMQPHEYRRGDYEAVVEWSEQVSALMRELAPDGNLERHHSPHFVSAYPYVQAPDPVMPVLVSVTNTYPHPLTLTLEPHLPEGVAGESQPQALTLAPGETGEAQWTFAAEGEGRWLIPFDVTANGERWGELAECYVVGQAAPRL